MQRYYNDLNSFSLPLEQKHLFWDARRSGNEVEVARYLALSYTAMGKALLVFFLVVVALAYLSLAYFSEAFSQEFIKKMVCPKGTVI